MKGRYPRILFFIKGAVPSVDDIDESEKMGPNVAFRNACFIPEELTDGAFEQCDGVAGAVPKSYANKFPTAKEALEKFEEERELAKQALKEAAEKKNSRKDFDSDSDKTIEITSGAQKLIDENELSKEEVESIEATGANGLIKSDIEKYLTEKTKSQAAPTWQANA